MNLRELVQRYDIRFKKALGQNLLLDPNINRIMADAAALGPEDTVVEVGAGLGALTGLLADRAGQVLAVEIDASFVPCLEDQFGNRPNVRIFRGDILNHELPALLEEFVPGGVRHKLVSNLPYYITTPILFHFLEAPVHFSHLVVMVQEEVGLRLVAPVGGRDYSVLSIAARLYADVDIVHRVPASCFVPRPKVDSVIVRFRRRESPRYPGVPDRFLLQLVRLAFSQRRRMLRKSLTRCEPLGVTTAGMMDALAEAGIAPDRRPQTLDIDEFAALARAVLARRTPAAQEAPP